MVTLRSVMGFFGNFHFPGCYLATVKAHRSAARNAAVYYPDKVR